MQGEAQQSYDAAIAGGKKGDALPPRVVGVCVGRGEAMDMLEGADGVVCVGWKAGEDLAQMVASCDVMVAPSEVSLPAVMLTNIKCSACFRGAGVYR